MGKKIPDSSGGGNFAPTAMIKEDGKMIKGTLVSKRDVTTMYGDKPVYRLAVLDATCDFTKDRAPADVKEGEEVEFFASSRLARQLVQVPFGSIVKITHTGKKKFGKGQPAHTYEVELEDK